MLLVHVCEKQNKETCMSSLYELDQKDTDWTCEMSWGCCPPPTTIHAAHLILIPHWNLIWFSLQVQHRCFSSHLKLETSHSLDELSLITKACWCCFLPPVGYFMYSQMIPRYSKNWNSHGLIIYTSYPLLILSGSYLHTTLTSWITGATAKKKKQNLY